MIKKNIKDKLLTLIKDIESEMNPLMANEMARRISDLREDIMNDFSTIVVIGEFKRGKSTFVNSLIGEKLLPMDVLPSTATINALIWSETRKTYVVKSDGTTETGNTTFDFLNNYSADKEFDLSKIKYLKIGLPAEILKDNVVIVDTPGVADINNQRADITYEFLPRADSIIFLLDASSPLKKTEKDFIDDHLLKLGIYNIIFVANKFDFVDEEEKDAAIEDIKKRIENAFKVASDETAFLNDIKLFPLIANKGLKGVLENDANLIVESGLGGIIEAIRTTSSKNENLLARDSRFKRRLIDIVTTLEVDLNNRVQLYKMDIDEIQRAILNIQDCINDEAERKIKVDEYISSETQKVLAMTNKSLLYFQTKLRNDIDEDIDFYKGSEFKHYIEKQLTPKIKKRISEWAYLYYPAIEKLFEKIEREISIALSNYFKQKIILKSNLVVVEADEFMKNVNYDVYADDVSGVNTKAGLYSAALAGILMLAGGPALVPFIGLAAFPFMQKKMLETKLEEAKTKIKPEISSLLNKSMYYMNDGISKIIDDKMGCIKKQANAVYDELLHKIKSQMENEITRRQNSESEIHEEINKIDSKLKRLSSIKNSIILLD